ncbi:hypothetical protein B0A55_02686 [Friedmanniomyces simplex]|uniref:Nucleolar 27S pre-rRNA processing Urb2/Npa2 C-terminal domain-containing protein n=1 Tax=Friedmanniomyces simplex TaxID=329884 RepID=A0A4U0XYK8_9PEZI|nr:hypothetical protein B0A55_02686 [Friedmanniomyces simplex]
MERSSLERLKALDTILDLESQLNEAQQLCTHSARADMVLRWLLEKLKQSAVIRNRADSWDLLAVSLRLLPLERLAILLGTADLVQIVQSTLHDEKVDFELLGAVASCLDLLFDLSNDGRGAALKALLGVDATKAATFSGTWLKATLRATAANGSTSKTIPYALLDPSMKIWAFRKQRGDEDEMFAEHCLVPAAALLAMLAHSPSVGPTKRKRKDTDGDEESDSRRRLETLLARHVFSPARLSFFDTHENQRQHARKNHLKVTPTGLSDRLHPVKVAIASDQVAPNSLPTLLDVALRCAPATNQRQRTKERPWNEVVFATLLDCLVQDGKLKDPKTLTAMLSVIGSRASLSKDTLQNLVKSHAKLGDDSDNSSETAWHLVAQAIALDANVFTNTELAARLFHAVSRAEEEAEGFRDSSRQLVDLDLSNLRRRDVLIPVMQAFAKSRSLSTFIDLWQQQLLRGVDKDRVWLQLGHSFSDLVETSLTQEQIVEIVGRLRKSLSSDITEMGLPADTVLIQAVLAGIRSSDLLDAVHTDVEALFDELLTSFDHYDSIMGSRRLHHIWKLLTTALSLWFPLWVAEQTNKEVVVERALSILASDAVIRARSILSGEQNTVDTVRNARSFALTLVGLLRPHSSRVPDMYTQATKGLSAEQLSTSVRAPGLLQDGGLTDTHGWLVKEYFEERLDEVETGMDCTSCRDGQRALVASSTQRPQSTVTKAMVDAALAYLESPGKVNMEQNTYRASAAVQQMLEVPAAALSVGQREHMLNAVALLPLAGHGPELARMRLSLLVQLLEEPCLTADVYSAALLWQQAHFGSMLERGKDIASPADGKILDLLECLAGRVVGHLLHHQSRNAGKASLLAIAAEAESTVDAAANGNGFAHDLHRLCLVKATFVQFDRHMRPELLEQCMRVEVIESYVNALIRDVETLAKEAKADQERQMALVAILSALANLPRRGGMAVDKKQSLVNTIFEIVRQHRTDSLANILADSRSIVLLRCLECLAREKLTEPAHNDMFVQLANSLLDQNLPPREHAAVLSAFSTACQSTDASTRIERLQVLLPGNRQPSGTSLLLLGVVLSTLSKEDFVVEPSGLQKPPQAFLHRLLGGITQAGDLTSCRRACECLILVLQSRPFMTNQHSVEATLACMNALAARRVSRERILFLDICRVATVLLQQHRSRLRERLHMVVELLQTLINYFFRKTRSLDMTHKPLTTRHARAMSRVLQLLCDPPQLRGKPGASDLVDDARKAQAHVGRYIQYVLHHYCSQVLKGAVGEGVREALVPGLWAMIEAMEINNADAVKSLSTAMNNGERAVLRSLYDEYKTFGKWRGG